MKRRDLVIAGAALGIVLAAVLLKAFTGWPQTGPIWFLNNFFILFLVFGELLIAALIMAIGGDSGMDYVVEYDDDDQFGGASGSW